jgi:cytochrome c5
MAPSPLANDPSERYSELERAYTEDRWPDVLEQGGQLIADLSNDPDPVTADLASRTHLLLGHAHLYGLRDPAAALPHYQALLGGSADLDLRRIAEEALPYCRSTVEPAAPEAAAGVFATAPTTATEAAASPTVAQELFPRAAIEPPAELLGDQILDTQGQWIHQTGTASEPITEAATPWLDGPIRQEQAIQTGVGGMIAAPGTTIGELVPSLEVEVVEEPELMEVAQADPSLAEEMEIELTRIRERRASHQGDGTATQELAPPAPADSLAEPDDLMEDPELLAGLLRVVVTP